MRFTNNDKTEKLMIISEAIQDIERQLSDVKSELEDVINEMNNNSWLLNGNGIAGDLSEMIPFIMMEKEEVDY